MKIASLILTSAFTIGTCATSYADPVHADVSQQTVSRDPIPTTITRVMVGGREKCRLSPPIATTENALALAAPIIAWAAGKLTESGVDWVSEYLQGIEKAESSSVTVNVQSSYFYKLKKNLPNQWRTVPALDCIVIARGKRGALDVRALTASAARLDPRGRFRAKDDRGVVDYPVLRDLGFADYPDLYVELAFQRDVFDTVFRARPQVIYYRQTNVKTQMAKPMDLNIVLAFSMPGGPQLGLMPIHMGGMQVGVDYSADLMSFDNPWLEMPIRPNVKSFASSPTARLISQIDSTPVNVTVTVEETGSPGRFAVLLSHALAGGKAEASKVASEEIQEVLAGRPKKADSDQRRK